MNPTTLTLRHIIIKMTKVTVEGRTTESAKRKTKGNNKELLKAIS